MKGGKRRKQSFSKIHTYVTPPFNGQNSEIGFSRIIYCNDPESPEAVALNYGTNYIRSTKYTLATFFPKAMFEQFRRVANVYFLLCAILSFTSLSPYSAVSTVLPFVIVVGVTMGKELLEDLRRKKQVVSDDEGPQDRAERMDTFAEQLEDQLEAGTEVGGDHAVKEVEAVQTEVAAQTEVVCAEPLDVEAQAAKYMRLKEEKRKRKAEEAELRRAAKKQNEASGSEVPQAEVQPQSDVSKTHQDIAKDDDGGDPEGHGESRSVDETGRSTARPSRSTGSMGPDPSYFRMKIPTPEEVIAQTGVDGILTPHPSAGLLALSAPNQFPADAQKLEVDLTQAANLGQSLIPQDIEVNNHWVNVHNQEGNFEQTKWMNLRVGDIIKVEKDQYFPADLILLSSSYDEGICYVETTNLDGETNLKLKQALQATSNLNEESKFKTFKAIINCEDPNANLYSFVGSFEFEGTKYSLTPQQLLLRDSKLKNTDYIYGVVVFNGRDTKVVQNSTAPPSKRSKIEKRTDKLVYLLFSVLVLLSFIGSVFFGIATREDIDNGLMTRWYLRPDNTTIYYNPKRATTAAILHFLTALMLYSYLIPISLYVSIEIVKVLQSVFINNDLEMYYEEGDKPAITRTSNLNEELGQVSTILSDKTGTLTCNSMEFMKCSVGGTAYGQGFTEVEKALARKNGDDFSILKQHIKGFNFFDERINYGKWVNEPRFDILQNFFRLMAICHTVIPEVDEETGVVTYEAESPDESAFVIAAKEFGFEFFERTLTSISLHELDPISGKKVERVYKVLNILEFNSSRKRMSVIIRDFQGKLQLLCKGADSVMFNRLADDGKEFKEQTMEHINEYAENGLRTLVLAYRDLDENEYNDFHKAFIYAKNVVSADREEIIDQVADKVEKNLILLGATAVEDKLQDGVPECIDKLAQAGIKLWVLTGDKMETAINIGFACSLLREDMKQVIINSDAPGFRTLEKAGNESAINEASKQNVLHQINEGKYILNESSESSEALALIIDGKSLTYALEDDIKDVFMDLALGCASVICCRSSPKQKALVTKLVKIKTGKTTLAIGDGANDVGMLQEADIGIGISGFEGMQAVMSSDIAIAQFCFLERLLLVHGHWCYRRMSSMICYFFYKNIAFGFTIFYFEAYASFSGQAAYNDWYLSFYNVLFTSLPVIALGVFDQDVSAQFCLKFPALYQEGLQNILFSWLRILSWTFNGALSATFIFFFCIFAMEQQAFRRNGQVVGLEILGTAMYTCVVLVVNFQMALSINYFTYIQHIFIWGSILSWYLFAIGYGAMDPYISTSAYKVFTEACATSPSFWLLSVFVLVSTLFPYFTYAAIQMRFYPMYHQMIQTMSFNGKSEDPEYCDMVRQRSLTPTTVGYSARFERRSSQSIEYVEELI